MFALSERDAITSSQSSVSKYLSIQRINDRYVWFVEGMARTTTSYLPVLKTDDGAFMEDFKLHPYMYQIHHRENDKKACVGCPILVVKRPNYRSGYVDNPKVDLTGIETNSQLVPHTIVDLPPILGNDNGMISIDNGYEFSSSKYFSNFHDSNDEFWLNDIATINPAQCTNHPLVSKAAYDTQSKLDTSGNSDVSDDNHPETAFPSLFGRALNSETGQVEFLLFDPKLVLRDNTVENPLPDGGGLTHYESDSKTWCANAPRSFLNEDHCECFWIHHLSHPFDYFSAHWIPSFHVPLNNLYRQD